MAEEEAPAAAPAEAEAAETALAGAPAAEEGVAGPGGDGGAATSAAAAPEEEGGVGESASGGAGGVGVGGAGEGEGEGAPSAEEDDGSPAVEATFVIMPENFQHSMQLKSRMSGADVKSAIAGELPLPIDTMSLKFKGEPLSDETRLADVGVNPGDAAEFELVVQYAQPGQSRAKARANVVPGQLPDSIDVELPPLEATSQPRVLTIPIDVSQVRKLPYLGGFRNKQTKVEYFHAQVQTDQKPREWKKDFKFTRETQTANERSRTIQTKREASTQMRRPDLLLDESRDVEVDSGAYETSEEFARVKEEKTMVLQRYARGWRARRLAGQMRQERDAEWTAAREADERARMKAEQRRRREIERRMRPRTHEDFEILYNELEAWRLLETSKINDADLPPHVKQATLKQLLHKETKLLQTIDRLKIAANHENRDVRIARTLADMATAKRWECDDGSVVEVHTPFTTRAKELMQLYNGLRLPLLTTDERLDVLLHVKWTVKEFDCNLTREIVELIDREADLLNRGRDPKSMEGLRRRLANLFLHFIETPEFNPEASKYTVSAAAAEQEAAMAAMTVNAVAAPSRESVGIQV